jgi:hypothetical protein
MRYTVLYSTLAYADTSHRREEEEKRAGGKRQKKEIVPAANQIK